MHIMIGLTQYTYTADAMYPHICLFVCFIIYSYKKYSYILGLYVCRPIHAYDIAYTQIIRFKDIMAHGEYMYY